MQISRYRFSGVGAAVRRAVLGLGVIGFAFTPLTAVAAPIEGLFATGVDGDGNALGDGAADPHYQIVSLAGTPQAVVINQGSIPGTWFDNAANYRWIWQTATGTPTNVTLDFRLTFDLTGFDPDTAAIAGQWATDNLGAIFLNGAATGNACSGFSSLCSFSIDDGFQAGLNFLDFRVTDLGSISGFLVSNIQGTAELLQQQPNPAPEPGLAVLFGLGLLGLRAFRRR